MGGSLMFCGITSIVMRYTVQSAQKRILLRTRKTTLHVPLTHRTNTLTSPG